MRVWDVDPGFLNDKSLLGEHREIHAIYTVLTQGKKGYARHPETLRWKKYLEALRVRHELIVSEMTFRGFRHHSPLSETAITSCWPDTMIDPPGRQFELLAAKYKDKPLGRIPLPENLQVLWAAHKYSVMARDPELSKTLGRDVAGRQIQFEDLALILVRYLRRRPDPGRLTNALRHMGGYIKDKPDLRVDDLTTQDLMVQIRKSVIKERINYLMQSTAIGELAFWCDHMTTKGS